MYNFFGSLTHLMPAVNRTIKTRDLTNTKSVVYYEHGKQVFY